MSTKLTESDISWLETKTREVFTEHLEKIYPSFSNIVYWDSTIVMSKTPKGDFAYVCPYYPVEANLIDSDIEAIKNKIFPKTSQRIIDAFISTIKNELAKNKIAHPSSDLMLSFGKLESCSSNTATIDTQISLEGKLEAEISFLITPCDQQSLCYSGECNVPVTLASE